MIKTALAAAAALATASGGSAASDITVVVTNVPSSEGRVGAGVCSKDEYLSAPCAHGDSAPAAEGEVVLTIRDVPAGEWGIVVLHDVNENGELDFKWFGPPAEAYGASNNPAPRMGPARWDDIVLTVGEEDMTVEIELIGGGS